MSATALHSQPYHKPYLLFIGTLILIVLIAGLLWTLSTKKSDYSPPRSDTNNSQLETHNTTGTTHGTDPKVQSDTPSLTGTSNNVSGNPKIDQ